MKGNLFSSGLTTTSWTPVLQSNQKRSWAQRLQIGLDSFKGLELNEPGEWPNPPKLVAYFGSALVGFLCFWFVSLSDAVDVLAQAQTRYAEMLTEKANLQTQIDQIRRLRSKKEDVEVTVKRLEQALPNKAEMDLLLSDINQTGLSRGLQFESFKPGKEVLHNYYADLPIALRVTGGYQSIASFAADLARLSRIVHLQGMNLSMLAPTHSANVSNNNLRQRSSVADDLVLEATIHTYRFLDTTEADPKRAAANKASDVPKRVYEAPQPFVPEEARVGQPHHPFSELRLKDGTGKLNLHITDRVKAELKRTKSPLENYAMDQLGMVGTVTQGGQIHALISSQDGIHTISQGDYIGLNFGKVVKVTESAVHVREWIQEPAGEWVERNNRLELQETRP